MYLRSDDIVLSQHSNDCILMIFSSLSPQGWPLDRSTLYTTVTKHVDPREIIEKLPSGCYVEGLFLEGAGKKTD